MNDLGQKLKDILDEFCKQHHAAPTDYEIRIGTTRFGRLTGRLIWNRYDNMEVSSRQIELWDYFRHAMPPEVRKNIGTIYTTGAQEWAVEEELQLHESARPPWM